MIPKDGQITANFIRTEFTGTEFQDAPISRYLRAPGGKYIQSVPPNMKIKKIKRNVSYSDYKGALNWSLKIGYVYAKAETPSQYHTNNDGEVTVIVSGTSPYYTISQLGANINKNTPFTIKGIDGDTGYSFTLIDSYQAAEHGYEAPSYNLTTRAGYGGGAGQGLFYKDAVDPAFDASAPAPIPNMWIYLPWHAAEENDGASKNLPQMKSPTFTIIGGKAFAVARVLGGTGTNIVKTPGGTVEEQEPISSAFMSDQYMYYIGTTGSSTIEINIKFGVTKGHTASYRTKAGKTGEYSTWKSITINQDPNSTADPTGEFTWKFTNQTPDTLEIQVINSDKTLLQTYTFTEN